MYVINVSNVSSVISASNVIFSASIVVRASDLNSGDPGLIPGRSVPPERWYSGIYFSDECICMALCKYFSHLLLLSCLRLK